MQSVTDVGRGKPVKETQISPYKQQQRRKTTAKQQELKTFPISVQGLSYCTTKIL